MRRVRFWADGCYVLQQGAKPSGGAGARGNELIRIHLTADDIEGLEILQTPDLSAELVRAGFMLANRTPSARLSGWRDDVARGWKPSTAKLFDLYSERVAPGVFDQIVGSDPAATATAVAATDRGRLESYLRTLTRTRRMTPFTRALANGRASAYAALGHAFADFQSVALDPFRRHIATTVAAEAARAGARAAASGNDALLRTLHPTVRLEKSALALDAAGDTDLELDGRSLVLRPAALSARAGYSGDMFGDRLIVTYPAGPGAVLRDPGPAAPSPSLVALLGPTRAAVLVAIARAPAVTTGRLAAAVRISAAAASRHAAVLRDAALITTFRDGMTVHHTATRLGGELIDGAGAGS